MIAWIKYAWDRWGPARCLMLIGFFPIWLIFLIEFLSTSFSAGLIFLLISVGVVGVGLWIFE